MPCPVHILASCRNRDLLKNTLLVFDTLRVGFPLAGISVFGNDLPPDVERQVKAAAYNSTCDFRNLKPTTHGEWIETLLEVEDQPFWICDTDIIFHGRVEDLFARPDGRLFAGRYEPEFTDRWLNCLHVARLHPSLMWFNPRALRAAIRAWPGKHPAFNTVERLMIRWTFIPRAGGMTFYDTCAGLHHALGGTKFTKAQNERFTHLFCGTYSDIAGFTDAERRAHEQWCKDNSPDD